MMKLSEFWKRVMKSRCCWLWTGELNAYGYGVFHKKGAHRWSWVFANGAIPDGLFVLHKCDIRNCVRPEHLFLGSQADNVADAVRKGAFTNGERRHGAKISDLKALTILLLHRRGVSQRWTANFFGVNYRSVWKIVHGFKWKHIHKIANDFDVPSPTLA